MDTIERIITIGFAPEASPTHIEAAAADLRLARILLRRHVIAEAALEEGVQLRNQSGLLLEHCLVRLGHVNFDTMLAAMDERRQAETNRITLVPPQVTTENLPGLEQPKLPSPRSR